MPRSIRGQTAPLCFLIESKNTNLVEDVEILLPVNYRWILFSGWREEVGNVSANQRPGRSSWFTNRPEKYKLDRWRWCLASCQVSSHSVQRFQKRSRKCLSQPEARWPPWFSDRAKKHKLGRERLDLASPQVSSNSVELFQRMWKVNDGQRVVTMH